MIIYIAFRFFWELCQQSLNNEYFENILDAFLKTSVNSSDPPLMTYFFDQVKDWCKFLWEEVTEFYHTLAQLCFVAI